MNAEIRTLAAGTLKFLGIALLGGSAVVALFALILVATDWTPRYDDDDSRYQSLAQQIAAVGERLSKGDLSDSTIDLTALNNGQWKAACILGGYDNVLDELEKLGATVSPDNRTRLAELTERGFRISQVEEFEVMVVFVDDSNEGQFIHFEGDLGSAGQHLRICTDRSKPKLELT